VCPCDVYQCRVCPGAGTVSCCVAVMQQLQLDKMQSGCQHTCCWNGCQFDQYWQLHLAVQQLADQGAWQCHPGVLSWHSTHTGTLQPVCTNSTQVCVGRNHRTNDPDALREVHGEHVEPL
jgi:hypothetical protein